MAKKLFRISVTREELQLLLRGLDALEYYPHSEDEELPAITALTEKLQGFVVREVTP
jgi:hypothetical protein